MKNLNDITCPFCNAAITAVINLDKGSPRYGAYCPTCEARGPLMPSELSAISAWDMEKTTAPTTLDSIITQLITDTINNTAVKATAEMTSETEALVTNFVNAQVSSAIEDADIETKVRDAVDSEVGDLDISDKASDAVSEYLETRSFERTLSDYVSDAVSNADIDSTVSDAVSDAMSNQQSVIQQMVRDAIKAELESLMQKLFPPVRVACENTVASVLTEQDGKI